ncbi:MAG TPA: glycosyltransferase [Gemmataceae bacterium]|jgi:glycosyltransferase involved in cell wall biosynthesis|nr:glycosyltransferase [Gemmataceae bacterium]
MGDVFFLLPDLFDSGWARQVSLLAEPGRPWTAAVFSATGDGPLTPEFRASGLTVLSQLGRAPKDLRGWLALRWLPPTPDRGLVHVFGLRTLRRLGVAAAGIPRRVVVSLTGHERLTWLDRRFLRPVHRVLVPHGTAADRLLAQGVPGDRVEVVPPAVAAAPAAPDRAAVGVAPDTPLAMTVARLDDYHRLSDAVWSFEFIHLSDPSTRLWVVGDGPARPRLELFSRQLAPEGSNIVFAGRRADAPGLIGAADVAFLPHRTGGATAALEAMAAGVPVVAADTPDLAAVVRDGVNGVLVPTASPPATAQQLRRFLFDADLRAQFGEAGRRVAREYSVERLTERMTAIYRA